MRIPSFLSMVAVGVIGFFAGTKFPSHHDKKTATEERSSETVVAEQEQTRRKFLSYDEIEIGPSDEEKESELRRIRKEAEQGDASAQLKLGMMYTEGEDFPSDTKLAVLWISKAAEQGLAEAQGLLGMYYEMGLYVPVDTAYAVHWFRKAAEQGDASAQYFLGSSLADGRYVPQDSAQAVHWFRKAAEQGDDGAMFSLSWCYQDGRGVARDLVQAYMWASLADTLEEFEKEMEGRPSQVEDLESEMTPEQIAQGQRLAREWYEKYLRK